MLIFPFCLRNALQKHTNYIEYLSIYTYQDINWTWFALYAFEQKTTEKLHFEAMTYCVKNVEESQMCTHPNGIHRNMKYS